VTTRSGETLKRGAIELGEGFPNERWITREFQNGFSYPATRSLQARIGAGSQKFPASTLFVIPAPQDQPPLLHGRYVNEAAEIFPGVGGARP
jgi:hypothetical protein